MVYTWFFVENFTGHASLLFAHTRRLVGVKTWKRMRQSSISSKRDTIGPGGSWSSGGQFNKEKYSLTRESPSWGQIASRSCHWGHHHYGSPVSLIQQGLQGLARALGARPALLLLVQSPCPPASLRHLLAPPMRRHRSTTRPLLWRIKEESPTQKGSTEKKKKHMADTRLQEDVLS